MAVSKLLILRSRADWFRVENAGISLNLTIPLSAYKNRGCDIHVRERREEGHGSVAMHIEGSGCFIENRIPNGDYIKRHAFWGGLTWTSRKQDS